MILTWDFDWETAIEPLEKGVTQAKYQHISIL
jgi:hypothetical protein